MWLDLCYGGKIICIYNLKKVNHEHTTGKTGKVTVKLPNMVRNLRGFAAVLRRLTGALAKHITGSAPVNRTPVGWPD